MDRKNFIEKAKILLGDNYDFTKTTFLNWHFKTIITCKIHGDFLSEPANIIYHKTGCPCCMGKKISKSRTLTNEKFIEKAKKIHGDNYDYSKVSYVNNSTKVLIICKIHGEFLQTPNNHLKGCKCPKCSLLKNPH